MVSEDLSVTLLKAGEEYLEALRKLHLEPDGLLWARANEVKILDSGNGPTEANAPGEWHLVLVTGAIDVAGPLAMNALLFKAYNLSATPQEISPFIVDVMSTSSGFVTDLINHLRQTDDWHAGFSMLGFSGADGKVTSVSDMVGASTLVHGLWFDKKWIYHLTDFKPKETARQRTWREFKKSVNALAA